MPITYRLGYIVNFYREPLLRAIEAEHGLTRPEWTVLLCLSAEEGLSASEICDLTGHLRNAVSRGVSMLERKKMIVRQNHDVDGRRQLLFLTDAGRGVFDKISPILAEAERQLMTAIPAAERAKFRGYLDLLAAQVRRMK